MPTIPQMNYRSGNSGKLNSEISVIVQNVMADTEFNTILTDWRMDELMKPFEGIYISVSASMKYHAYHSSIVHLIGIA